MFRYDPTATLKERDFAHTGQWTLRAPMLALSNPDTALAFPPGTALHPQLFIRNTTAKPVAATLRFNWRAENGTGKAAGPALQLGPYQTQRVDVAALQDAGAIPKAANWASVRLVTNSSPDEVMAVAASYDDTLRYGTQTPFSDRLGFQWEGGMWEYDAYHDSIITAGNGGTGPTNVVLTLFYNEGTKSYELGQTLQPDEQMWVDVGKLIREQTPDKNGNALPSTLSYGSYEIRDLTHRGVGTVFEGKVIYDKMYGHAAYGCTACCGYAGPLVDWNPLGIPDGGTAAQGVQARSECSRNQYVDVSDLFYGNWSTGNTAIATVNYSATHTGVSFSISAQVLDVVEPTVECQNQTMPASGQDNTNVVGTLVIPTKAFVTSVASGSGTFNPAIQVGNAGGSFAANWTIAISGPYNPSGVTLQDGTSGTQASCSTTGNGTCQAPSAGFHVSSAATNTVSGTVTYTITASTTTPHAQASGSPQTVTVSFQH